MLIYQLHLIRSCKSIISRCATIPRRNYAKGGSAGQYVVQRIWPFGFRSWSSFSSKLCCSLPRPSQLEKLRPAPLSRYNTASFRASSCPWPIQSDRSLLGHPFKTRRPSASTSSVGRAIRKSWQRPTWPTGKSCCFSMTIVIR